MSSDKNLVKEYLEELGIINSDQLFYNAIYEDVEWDAYKLSDDEMLYVTYELTPDGIGSAFCAKIKCTKLTYNIESKHYTKSFTNRTINEWDGISDTLRDKMLSDAIRDLETYNH